VVPRLSVIDYYGKISGNFQPLLNFRKIYNPIVVCMSVQPVYTEVVNESYMHNVDKGIIRSFRLVIQL